MPETAEQVAKDLNISDFDAGNERDKMFLGIITKLRGKNRELSNSLDTMTTRYNTLNDEVTTHRRTAKEQDIITSVLGDKKYIAEADKPKFERWKAKLANGDDWEDELKQLVEDFATDKPADDTKDKEPSKKDASKKDAPADKAPEKDEPAKDDKPEDKKPTYTPRRLRGSGTEEVAGTTVRAPRTMSERLRLAKEDPEAYDQFRAQNGRA